MVVVLVEMQVESEDYIQSDYHIEIDKLLLVVVVVVVVDQDTDNLMGLDQRHLLET